MGTTPQNILTPLDVNNFTVSFDPSDPGFTDYVNQTLGDAATAADGFDDAVSDVLSLLDLLDSGLAAIQGLDGGTLDDAFIEALQIDPADVANDQGNFLSAYPAYGAATDELGSLVTSASGPTEPTQSNTIFTPNAAANCSGTNTILDFNLASSPNTQFFDVNIQDPFDIGAHLTDIGLDATGDPQFFTLYGYNNTYVQIGAPAKVATLSGIFANPGEYWCQITMQFNLDAHAGPGTLHLCIKVVVS